MPSGWSRDGYYSLSEKAGQLWIEKKNVGKVLVEGLLDGTPKLRDYTIDMNFSEHRAKIRSAVRAVLRAVGERCAKISLPGHG